MIFGTESECFKASCNDCIARDYNVYSAILIENSYKSGPFMILGMDHFTIVTTELEATRCFYVDLIGLEKGPRPQFPVDGLWLYTNGKAILHVISVNSMPKPRRSEEHTSELQSRPHLVCCLLPEKKKSTGTPSTPSC